MPASSNGANRVQFNKKVCNERWRGEYSLPKVNSSARVFTMTASLNGAKSVRIMASELNRGHLDVAEEENSTVHIFAHGKS